MEALFLRFGLLWLLAVALPWAGAHATALASVATLRNGLQLIVLTDHRLPVVTHVVYYRAGSADDPPNQTGIAHFLEHLMFKGTRRYPTGQYDAIVSRAGGANNAYTSPDKTYYYEQIQTRGLAQIMDIDADRMAGLDFAASEAEHELSVVIEERRSYDNDPESVLAQKVSAALYGSGAYAHPVLGEWTETGALTQSAALAFHHRFYGPAAAIVIVAGDVEPSAVLKLAEATYGQLPAGPPPAPRAWSAQATACADGRVEERHPRVARDKVSLIFLTPGTAAMGVRTAAALELLADILQSETASPLWQDLVARRRLADSLAVGHDLRLAAGEFSIALEAADGIGAERIEGALRQAMRQLLRTGIAAPALAEAKRHWLANAVLSSDDQLGQATRYGELLAIGRSVADIENEPEVIASVTLPEVNGVLQGYLSNRCALTAVLTRPADAQPASLTPPVAAIHPTTAVR